MTILDAFILGIVEGVTEFLPISSTGHLILANSILGIEATEFVKTFDIAIQLGAISAAALLYWKSFLDIEILKRVFLAFIPTGLIGLALYSVIKTYLLGNPWVVVLALFLGGIALIIFELLHAQTGDEDDSVKNITYAQAALVGLFQSFAIIPGISRSAATIVGGLLVTRLSRRAIVEFSFLLAVPTMAAATGLDLLKNASSFASSDLMVLGIGFVTSFAVALAAINFLLSYLRGHSFIAFGVYRIAVALLFFVYFLY
jgi:undecaprenyl-diphosphatase